MELPVTQRCDTNPMFWPRIHLCRSGCKKDTKVCATSHHPLHLLPGRGIFISVYSSSNFWRNASPKAALPVRVSVKVV